MSEEHAGREPMIRIYAAPQKGGVVAWAVLASAPPDAEPAVCLRASTPQEAMARVCEHLAAEFRAIGIPRN